MLKKFLERACKAGTDQTLITDQNAEWQANPEQASVTEGASPVGPSGLN